jgi:hypothetical protein
LRGHGFGGDIEVSSDVFGIDNTILALWSGDFVKLVWYTGEVNYGIIQFDEYRNPAPFVQGAGVYITNRNQFQAFRISKEEYVTGKALEAISC